MSKIPPPKERFKNTVIDLAGFCEEMLESLRTRKYKVLNPANLKILSMFLISMEDELLIDTFIKKSHNYWKQIKTRDEDFFINHSTDIFEIPADQAEMFIDLFTLKDPKNNYAVSKDDRDGIWEYFESLVKISINYIHETRGPIIVPNEKDASIKEPKYLRTFMNSEINLRKTSKEWGIELKF